MAGLVPAIHVVVRRSRQDADARDKRGHDGNTLANSASWPERILRHGRACPGHPRLYPAAMSRGGFVYFMTNRRHGALYVGVTSNLLARSFQHREGLFEGFTKQYGLKYLVYYEQFEDIRDAIQREKSIKHWPRAWKVRLIHAMNPEWKNLYPTLTP